jgi:hypothetical protein
VEAKPLGLVAPGGVEEREAFFQSFGSVTSINERIVA